MITIPRNVADAIEHLRSEPNPFSNGKIISSAMIQDSSLVFAGWATGAIRSIPLDTLLEALINGYEREKTPEEVAEEERQAVHDRIRNAYKRKSTVSIIPSYSEVTTANAIGFADGIKFALNELGISIEGVNV